MKSQRVAVLIFSMVCSTAWAAKEKAPSSPAAATAPAEGVININTASVAELQLLPTIGPSKAERIVAHRTKSPFRTPGQITRVKGIGAKTFVQLKPYLTVDGPTTLKTKLTGAPKKAKKVATKE